VGPLSQLQLKLKYSECTIARRSSLMPAAKALACLAVLALPSLLCSQTQPLAYTVSQMNAMGGASSTSTVYRDGNKALLEIAFGSPVQHTRTLYNLAAKSSYSWDPNASPITCTAGNFSGDWGDPFNSAVEAKPQIASGELKPAGAETVIGIPASIYTASSADGTAKIWYDEKDSLVLRVQFTAPNAAPATMVDVKSVSMKAPDPSIFALPAACASVKAPPTEADVIAEATGDNPDNFVRAGYGPGSKDSCSIVVRVVAAKTMAPVTRKWQFAIDTTYNIDNTPPDYAINAADDGTSTFAGGGMHEITSQIRNDTLRIDNPPAYFNAAMNVVQPGHGAAYGLVYRQCFAPVTMLYYILKDPNDPGAGADWLYAKAGKYAAVPTN
jgi:hypothetical protein